MGKLTNIFRLLRPSQWFKNLLIPAVGIFSFQFLTYEVYLYLILGFLCACGISSANYIINDVVDFEQDQLHPKKRKRPIASGLISRRQALLLVMILLPISLFCSFLLSFWFGIFMLLLFSLSQAYTFYLKQLIFVDVLTITVNFLIR
ncbi:MAG: UbiA family prenyltransferase, partial [Candidatus Helarchaeota archaeon]